MLRLYGEEPQDTPTKGRISWKILKTNDTPLAETRPRAPSKGAKNSPVAFQLPDGHYEYLSYVVRVSRRFGDTENEAAWFILIRELIR